MTTDYRTSPDDTVPRADYDRIVPSNVSPARVLFYATLALVVGNNIVYALGWFAVQ